MSRILKTSKPRVPKISKEERESIAILRKDKDIKIPPPYKGKCTVVLDTNKYMEKCKNLLDDSKTYNKIKKDPMKKHKDKLSALLLGVKRKESIDYKTWYTVYRTSNAPPVFYRLPEKHAILTNCQQLGKCHL